MSKKPPNKYINICSLCHKEFVSHNLAKLYCSKECKSEATRLKKEAKKKKKNLPSTDLVTLAEEAAKRGLSYGKYVALISEG